MVFNRTMTKDLNTMPLFIGEWLDTTISAQWDIIEVWKVIICQ